MIILEIVHVTSVHGRYDTRIFQKMCRSLAVHGFKVTLLVADGRGDEVREGINIFDVGAPRSRLDRMWRTAGALYRRAMETTGSLFHFHDPELIPVAIALKRQGRCIVFDAHEDITEFIVYKPYISRHFRPLLSLIMVLVQNRIYPLFDGLIAATPHIQNRIASSGAPCVTVCNFPIIGEFNREVDWDDKKTEICYVGSISAERGLHQLFEALRYIDDKVRLNLVGRLEGSDIEKILKVHPSRHRVNELGFLDRKGVARIIGRSIAGVVTLMPNGAYRYALPVKMFEYMAAGIPVIASDFPLWREIIESNSCGLLVDPLDPQSISFAANQLVANRKLASEMGARGRAAVENHFNWSREEKTLMHFYRTVLRVNGTSCDDLN